MDDTNLKIVMKPTDSLVPYARNARTHSPEQVGQIAASIKEFGFCNPVLIDAEGGIIAGHGRVLAAQKLGRADVPTITLGHLTETQRRAYILADNKLALNAGWDEEMLKIELEGLKTEGFDLALTGFDSHEVAPISRPAGDKAGASPWDRVGDAADGVVFSFGARSKRVEKALYDDFVRAVGDREIEAWLNEVLHS